MLCKSEVAQLRDMARSHQTTVESISSETEQLRKQHASVVAENAKLKATLAQTAASENALRVEVDRAQHDLTVAAEKMGQQSLMLAEVQGELSTMHAMKRTVVCHVWRHE